MILLEEFVYDEIGKIAHFLENNKHIFFKILETDTMVFYEELTYLENQKITDYILSTKTN